MDPLLILLIGMAVVIGGVLWLRLHAFVALIGGALVVGSLATPETIEQSVLKDSRIEKEMRKQATNRFGKDDPNLMYLVQLLHETLETALGRFDFWLCVPPCPFDPWLQVFHHLT